MVDQPRKCGTCLKLIYYISLSGIVVLGYFTLLAFIAPKQLKIQKDSVGTARVSLIASVIFYVVIALILRITVMRSPPGPPQHIQKKGTEDHQKSFIEMANRNVQVRRRSDARAPSVNNLTPMSDRDRQRQ